MSLPVVDIFAGAGGLGEGFARAGFEVALSIEKDQTACKTLILRKYYNLFKNNDVPEDYYSFITGKISFEKFLDNQDKNWKIAKGKVFCATLGDKKIKAELHKKISASTKNSKEFILVGGPPCQAYSIAGRSRMIGGLDKKLSKSSYQQKMIDRFYNDPRHTLYKEYIEILAIHRPAIFLMENVKGIGSAKTNESAEKGSIFYNITEGLKSPELALCSELSTDEINHTQVEYDLYSLCSDITKTNDLFGNSNPYSASDFLIKSEEYGIPQSRHRVLILGIRKDYDFNPEKLIKNNKYKTVKNAIFNLPAIRSGFSKQADNDNNWTKEIKQQILQVFSKEKVSELKIEELLKEMEGRNQLLNRGSNFIKDTEISFEDKDLEIWFKDIRLNGVIQHEARGHMISDLCRYMYCSAHGQIYGKSPSLDTWGSSMSKLLPKHKNIKLKKDGKLDINTHNDRFKVQVWNKPSSTVVSHISKDGNYFIHPDPTQCRSLTVREAARLQTFPDNYWFCGNRTQQFHQIGNAVPPYLSFQIANLLK